MAAIGHGAELTFVEKTCLPHLSRRLWGQIESKVAILVHRDLPLCKVDAVSAQQSLHPGKTLLLNDRGHPRIARAISDALCSTLSHFDLVPRRVGERPDETIEAGCLARRDPRSCGALRKAEILRLPSLLADPRSAARSVKTDLALGVELPSPFGKIIGSTLARPARKAQREWEWIDQIPAFKTYERSGKVRVRCLTHDQARALMDKLPAHQREVVLFALSTGLRQGNILNLTWDRVDMNRAIATIEHGDTKNGAALGVPLNAIALGVLGRHAQRHRS